MFDKELSRASGPLIVATLPGFLRKKAKLAGRASFILQCTKYHSHELFRSRSDVIR
jgi:hypothetical protein